MRTRRYTPSIVRSSPGPSHRRRCGQSRTRSAHFARLASTRSSAVNGSTSSCDLGAELPMRTIGMLAGIPDAEQPAVRQHANQVLRNEQGKPMAIKKDHYFTGEMFGEYVEWRQKNPSDDLITELLNVEFEDETGTRGS